MAPIRFYYKFDIEALTSYVYVEILKNHSK